MSNHISNQDFRTLQAAKNQLMQAQAIWQFTLGRLAEHYQIDTEHGEQLDVDTGHIVGRSALCDALGIDDEDFKTATQGPQ